MKAVRGRVAAILLLAPVAFTLSPVPSAGLDGLNPPPDPGTTCKSTGGGTICRARLTTTFSFPAEFTCSGPNSFDINEAATTDREVVFTYDQEGNLTKRVTRIISLGGTFSNAVTGKSVGESGHFTITHNFLTPGALSTDQTTFNGLFTKVVVPWQGIVLQDAGHIVFAPNDDVLAKGGHHQLQDRDLARLCAALS
jgi:hypothetical protein